MREPSYREAIGQAWHLVWHNKILWIFGLLSAFAGQFGIGNFLGQIIARGQWILSEGQWTLFVPILNNWSEITSSEKVSIVWLGIIILILILVILFISIAAQGANIRIAADWYKKKKDDSFGYSWHVGVRHFWPLLWVNLAQKIIIAFLLLSFTLIWNDLVGNGAWGNTLMALTLFIMFLTGLIVSCWSIYTAGYIVAEENGLRAGLAKGWRLFCRHWLVSIELSFLLLVMGVILVAAVALASMVVLAPSVAIWLTGLFLQSSTIIWIGFVLGMFLWIVFIVWAGALFNAFTTSAWIYLFMSMRHEGLTGIISKTLKKIFKR